jgi:tryptophan synthase alpha chain
MNLLKQAFQKKCLIPYFTFGDPSTKTTETIIRNAFEAGTDIIEIGIPFSDPIADGPVIQASHHRALSNGEDVSIKPALQMVKRIKKDIQKPLLFMMAYNLIINYGITTFFKMAESHQLDGVIIPDLPPEEASECAVLAKQHSIALVMLVSPLCEEKRLKTIVKMSSGFVYLISTTGTTGERVKVADGLENIVKKIKDIKDIPVAIGFGISKKEHVKNIHEFADGAIVGSSLVKQIHNNGNIKTIISKLI